MVNPPMERGPSQWVQTVSGFTTPASSAAAMMIVFMVEPGSYVSATSGLANRSEENPCQAVGENDGVDAMAKTAPVPGSITTTDPAFAPYLSSAFCRCDSTAN